MPVSNDLIERTADLKGELVEFALQPRFDRAFRQASDEYFGLHLMIDEADVANNLD
jgi:hypothetical protein